MFYDVDIEALACVLSSRYAMLCTHGNLYGISQGSAEALLSTYLLRKIALLIRKLTTVVVCGRGTRVFSSKPELKVLD